ncbi:hypothetical protein [Streptomyces shenzhenensis]|uniref:hypothetical protein n=1 Tax=Streptomyces shenzhenensis TaxID=943815 RepID=UPI0015F0866F|nr:hypothetical protein [Streptomyces shenzhenensis]
MDADGEQAGQHVLAPEQDLARVGEVTGTQELLGWKPTHPGPIEDVEQSHCFL